MSLQAQPTVHQDPSAFLPAPEISALLESDPRIRAAARHILESGQPMGPGLQLLARARQLQPDENATVAHPRRVAAFFDIDGTLISGSIIQQMTLQGFKEGHGTLEGCLQFAACYLLYKLNLIPRINMYRWGYKPCEGHEIQAVQDFVDRCLEARIKPRVFREAVEAINAHRAAGHLVVAITGAPDYAAAELSAYLGLHDVLATPTPLSEDGRITTDVQEPVCYASGKLAYLRAYAARHEIDLTRSFFYSDSASDIPVLEVVGHPRVVNPQLMLRPVAWKRGWPVARWNTLRHSGLPVASMSRALTVPVARR
ncbi:MAG: HAD-IB family hydrolase [Myxococcota bacterium]